MKSSRTHALLVFISGLFYVLTLAPTLIGGDSSSFCLRIHRFEFLNVFNLSVGGPDDHPLHIVLGKIFSWLLFELAYSVNLMSAFFSVFTVLTIFLVLQHLTNSPYAASFGALSLMVSHAFWQHSVIAEVYTLNAFFVALLLYLVLTQMKHHWFPVMLPLAVILGLLNHLILALVLPALCLYILVRLDAKLRKRVLFWGGGALSLLLLALFGLFLFRAQAMKAWFHAMLVGPPPIKHYLFPPGGITPFFKEILFYLLYLLYQYPIGGVLLGVLGIIQLGKKEKAVLMLLLLMMLLNGLFFIKTTSWGSYGGTKYTFYISDYTVFAVCIGYGAFFLFTELEKWLKKRGSLWRLQWLTMGMIAVSVILTVMFYALMPSMVSALNIDLLHARILPNRENNSFFLNPNKRGYYGDRKFGEEILERCKEDAIVFADFTPYTILRYLQIIEHKRSDIRIIRCDETMNIRKQVDAIKQETPDRPVYLADNNSYYNLKGLDELYVIQPYASFFEIIPRR